MKLSNLYFQILIVALFFTSLTVARPLAAEAEGPQSPLHDEVKTERPLILSPKDISEFRGRNTIEFVWLKIPGAARYHVVLAKDRGFRQIVRESSGVAEASYNIGDLDFGTFFFKVAAISPDGTAGPFSETLSFIIVPPPPARTPLLLTE